MDFADKMDMMDDDCDIEGFPLEDKVLNIRIWDLLFVQTCRACPEQYDVFACNGDGTATDVQVGYVRLRHGGLRCDYPECGGEEIYYRGFKDGLGSFKNEQERRYFLTDIAYAIQKKMENKEEE